MLGRHRVDMEGTRCPRDLLNGSGVRLRKGKNDLARLAWVGNLDNVSQSRQDEVKGIPHLLTKITTTNHNCRIRGSVLAELSALFQVPRHHELELPRALVRHAIEARHPAAGRIRC
jgi:hypothetical protein